MPLLKAFKGWREVLRLAFFRKGPKQLTLKPNVPKVAKYEENRRFLIRDTQSDKSTFLRSIFSNTSKLLARYRLKPLQPRYAGVNRSRAVPFLSLIGLSLSLSDNVDIVSNWNMETTMNDMREIFKGYKWEPECLDNNPKGLGDLEINKTCDIGNGCEGAVFEAKLKNDATNTAIELGPDTPIGQDYNLAVKAVFNYGAESNASCIVRQMNKEIVPLQSSKSEENQIDEIININVFRLPSHPNVVDMHCVFIDDMLVTEQIQSKFPAAVPRCINPDRYFARNKTLYLVMRKCTHSLSEFLSSPDITMTTRYLLLLQLLEAVNHMTSHGVAHRDIKADNVLIDVSVSGGTPRLQVCDFGCCLAEESKKLEIPFVSRDVNLGGNPCLMAPEISCAKPGDNSILDFRKSDLWACGTLAYQILGADNPFYRCNGSNVQQLKSQTYSEDELPPLPDNVPAPIQRLVRSILSRDPAKRPSASVAVLVVQMVLWESRRRKHHQGGRRRVVVTKGNRLSSYVHYLNKERQKMGLVLAEMVDLVKKMKSTRSNMKQDMIDISIFLCLSRLTHSDFITALKFFH